MLAFCIYAILEFFLIGWFGYYRDRSQAVGRHRRRVKEVVFVESMYGVLV